MFRKKLINTMKTPYFFIAFFLVVFHLHNFAQTKQEYSHLSETKKNHNRLI